MQQTLDIPAGVFANGTDLQASGRWRRANLVRWRDGAMQPVGGWAERTSSGNRPAAAVRGITAWRDNSADRWVGMGTYDKLYVLSASGTLSDITPAGFSSGSETAALDIGYGKSFYGTGFYGTPRPDDGTYDEATVWTLDNWGEYLVGCSTDDGKLYEWTLNTGSAAAQISNSPTSCLGLSVTAERFIFALGAGGNPKKIEWCDREDNTTWTAAATNEAGGIELQTSGQIMLARRVQGQHFILTDTDAHVATYTGPPFVYQIEKVGDACGAVSRRSAVTISTGEVYWMTKDRFCKFNGGTVQDLPCEVSDYVFGDISRAQESIIFAVENSAFREVWWFYPCNDATVCDRYVSYNYAEGYWTFGDLERCAGVDRGVFPNPIWLTEGGYVYDHESGRNTGSESPYAESGPILLGDGERMHTVSEVIPDEGTAGEVTLTLKSRQWPNATETEHGPYTAANPINVLFTGRQTRLQVNGVANKDWRWGVPRLTLRQRGRK